jgi:hypothetical protein
MMHKITVNVAMVILTFRKMQPPSIVSSYFVPADRAKSQIRTDIIGVVRAVMKIITFVCIRTFVFELIICDAGKIDQNFILFDFSTFEPHRMA